MLYREYRFSFSTLGYNCALNKENVFTVQLFQIIPKPLVSNCHVIAIPSNECAERKRETVVLSVDSCFHCTIPNNVRMYWGRETDPHRRLSIVFMYVWLTWVVDLVMLDFVLLSLCYFGKNMYLLSGLSKVGNFS